MYRLHIALLCLQLVEADLEERDVKENSAASIKYKVPWKKILMNKSVIGLVLFQTFYNWGYYLLLATFPQYLQDVHNVDVSQVEITKRICGLHFNSFL